MYKITNIKRLRYNTIIFVLFDTSSVSLAVTQSDVLYQQLAIVNILLYIALYNVFYMKISKSKTIKTNRNCNQ